ncbi:MAG: hypothetical protein C4K58_01970 [Flavobacteriaceae bacterium]|nr:MAG: hypothetical protein C4K58_01970 [Flavobacteriaceae bacterium]
MIEKTNKIFDFAPISKRATAYLLDGLFLGLLHNSLLYLLPNCFYNYVLVSLVLLLYKPLLESSSKKASLGKLALGIAVTDQQGKKITFHRSMLRNLPNIATTLLAFPLMEKLYQNGLVNSQSLDPIIKFIENLLIQEPQFQILQLMISLIFTNNVLLYLLDRRSRSLGDRLASTFVLNNDKNQ